MMGGRTIAQRDRETWLATVEYHAEALRRCLPVDEPRQRTLRDQAQAVIDAIRAYELTVEGHRDDMQRRLTTDEQAEVAQMVNRLGYTRHAAEYEIRTRRYDGSDVTP